MSELPHFEEARAGLVRHFGLSDFRPGQAEVINSVISGRNTVVVMPTGAGKSLCYQLPATLLPGITLVVSPLIALMKDQVEQLESKGISATFINSTLSDLERAERIRNMRAGVYKLVYVAPERFRSPAFYEAVLEAKIELLAIDEAHCISQWGHDFRPDYAMIGQARKRLRPPRTVALTATATPEVRDDIVKSLLMKDPAVFVAGFDRPNLFLEVCNVTGEEDRRNAALMMVERGGSGIIYCSTRKQAEGLNGALKSAGKKSVLYHAGMDDEARRRAQDEFMSSRDAIAVATNAFGMGIDKPDIRFVAHANIPRAVEAYYQEIGRAGRDGEASHVVLLFNHADVYTQERLITGSHPPESVFADVWNLLARVGEFDRGIAALAGAAGASEFEVGAALRILERAGKIERGGAGEGSWSLTLQPRSKEVQPHAEESKTLLAALTAAYPVGKSVSVELPVLSRRSGLGVDAVRHALTLLQKSGAITVRKPFTGKTIRALSDVPFRELGLDLGAMREQERRALLLLKRMTDYAYSKKCRRGFLLRYFDESEAPTTCGSCDVCVGPRLIRPEVKRTTVSTPGSSVLRPGDYSELAFMELRRWRKDLARDLDVPPYIIFNDATLLAIAAALPVDRTGFLNVKGTGESRWERFGPKVVEISTMARAAGHVPNAAAVQAFPRKRRAAR